MSRFGWGACLAWIALALAFAARGAVLAARSGDGPALRARLASPTVYLFAGYLVVAGFVTPRSPGESSSPLFGLALVLPLAYVAASLSAAGHPRRGIGTAAGLFVLHGGAVAASAAVVLALASPGFVPTWLR